MIEFAVFGKTEIPIISAKTDSRPPRTIGNNVVMHSDPCYPEQFIVIRTVFRCDFHPNIAAVDEIITDLYIASAVDIDPACAEIILPVLKISGISLRTYIVDHIIPADPIPHLICVIRVPAAVLLRMHRQPFESDHIDPDVVIIVDCIFSNEESVNIAVQDQGFA